MRFSKSYDLALNEIIKKVPLTATPTQALEQVTRIAEDHQITEQRGNLLVEFMEYYDIDEWSIIIAILQNGSQVRVSEEYDEEDVLDELSLQVVASSFSAAKNNDSWGEIFEVLFQETIDEVQFLSNSMNEEYIRWLFGFLLYDRVKKKQDELFEEVFPHLRADPEKITHTLSDSKAGIVLLLGKDTGEGLDRLNQIKNRIEEEHARTCVLLRDEAENAAQGFRNKLLMYGTLARYIVVEDTFQSSHRGELERIDQLESVVGILRQEGKGASSVYGRQIETDEVKKVFEYDLPKDLESTIDELVQWAEEAVERNKQINRDSYDWLE